MKNLIAKLFAKPVQVIIRMADRHLVREYMARGFNVVTRIVRGVLVWVATR